jgi:PKD repeat protein
VADFIANTATGAAPLTVTFTDTSTNSPSEHFWDFDSDGHTDSTDPAPAHIYPNPGTYTVTLRVANPDGSDEEVKTNYILVSGGQEGEGEGETPHVAVSSTPSLVALLASVFTAGAIFARQKIGRTRP